MTSTTVVISIEVILIVMTLTLNVTSMMNYTTFADAHDCVVAANVTLNCDMMMVAHVNTTLNYKTTMTISTMNDLESSLWCQC